MTSPDQVLLSGVLESGAVVSVRIKGGHRQRHGVTFRNPRPRRRPGYREADLSPGGQGTSVQISEFTVRSAQCAEGQDAGGSPDTGELSLGSTPGACGASLQRCSAQRTDS